MYAFRHKHNDVADNEPTAGPDFFNDTNNNTTWIILQIVQEVYQIFGERNVPALLAHFDKDINLERPEAMRIFLLQEHSKEHEGMIKMFLRLITQSIQNGFICSRQIF